MAAIAEGNTTYAVGGDGDSAVLGTFEESLRLYYDLSGNTLVFPVPSGGTYSWDVASTVEMTLSATELGLAGVNLTMGDAAGPALQNEAATATNPTLIPNRADLDTGIGWVSANLLSLVAGGVESARVAATVMTMAAGVDIQFSTTGFPIMAITDTDGAVEAQLWYSAADNKLEFFNGSAKEAITSSGFLWQAYENPTIYRQMYSPSFNDGINPDVFVKEGTWSEKPLIPGLSIDQFEWHVGDKSIMVVESFLSDGEVHALPYPLEEALRETEWAASIDERLSVVAKAQGIMSNGWLKDQFQNLVENDEPFRAWAREKLTV